MSKKQAKSTTKPAAKTAEKASPPVPAPRAEVEAGAATSVMEAWEKLRHKPKPEPADYDRMIQAQRADRVRWMAKDAAKAAKKESE